MFDIETLDFLSQLFDKVLILCNYYEDLLVSHQGCGCC